MLAVFPEDMNGCASLSRRSLTPGPETRELAVTPEDDLRLGAYKTPSMTEESS